MFLCLFLDSRRVVSTKLFDFLIENELKMDTGREAIIALFKAGKSNSDIVKSLSHLKINKVFVWRVIKRFKETGGVQSRPRSGRPRSKRTPEAVKAVRAKIRRNPRRSMRKMANESNISENTMRRIVKDDLKMKPFTLQKRQVLTEATKVKRLTRAKHLLSRIRKGTLKNVVFTDEKIFTVETFQNRHNDKVLARDISKVPTNQKTVFRIQHPASVMVWAGITAEGKAPLVFVPPGVKVNAQFYIKSVLEEAVLPWSREMFKNEPWTFMQDGAPSHTAKVTQDWLKKSFPGFLTKEEWPPSSPDLNPMDFSVWNYLQTKVGQAQHRNIESLKSSLIKEWDEMPLSYVRATSRAFAGRLRRVVEAEGGHFE